jgi:hypothetical protein
MNFTPNFTYEELTHSEYAVRHGIDNRPSPEQEINLLRVANALEVVRELLGGFPISISSGYRNQEVNEGTGGSRTSAHMKGLAVDFFCPAYGRPFEIADYLATALPTAGLLFDQLIHEYGRWVHLGLAEDGVEPRLDLLTYYKKGALPLRGIHEVTNA